MPRLSRWVPRPALLLAAVTALSLSVTPGVAAEPGPSLKLIAPDSDITVYRYGTEDGSYFDPRILVAAIGQDFEVWVNRADYDSPIQGTWVRGGVASTLPSWATPSFRGMPGFLKFRVTDRDGDVVVRTSKRFCPQGGSTRVAAGGPVNPRYPIVCPGGPFTLGTVWGIDRGWATPAIGWEGFQLDLPAGRYQLRTTIAKRYRQLFGIPLSRAVVDITLRVREGDGEGCPPFCPEGLRPEPTWPTRVRGPLGVAPSVIAPDPETMPDLVALPAFEIHVRNRRNGRSFVEFAATVWNSGPSPMLVEGYRREDEDVMDAYQYFFQDGEVVGRARVGKMEYHRGGGHSHWHFKQFAGYSLLDATRERVVRSKKEAFCLVPTDAVDLTVPNADWRPTGDLATSCGGEEAIWVREVLQSGWGDTYYQSVAGQSLDITGLPNGTYYVAVEADPSDLLHERTRSNNRTLRRIVLGGSPGSRTVTVFPWHGITA